MITLLHNVKHPETSNEAVRVFFKDDVILKVVTGENSSDGGIIPDNVIDGRGCILLPGCIDAHVHFREPGLTHKADVATESRAALAGGITAWFDMPNTKPPTTTMERLNQKREIASQSSVTDYAFFIGATNDNLDDLATADYSRIPGIKIFMGSSTGNMLVDNEQTLRRLFENFRVPLVAHAEDEATITRCRKEIEQLYGSNPPIESHSRIRPVEACVAATRNALSLLRQHPGARLHIAHLSTADEVDLIRKAKQEGFNVTCEVSPHHLLFSTDDYPTLGSRIKMNPSVKAPYHRDALRSAVADGTIDIVATDHAPHTLAEKDGNAFTAVSGAPMTQFALPAVCELFGIKTARRVLCENPARIFGVERYGKIAEGYRAAFVLIRQNEKPYTITDSDVLSKCGWTPLTGFGIHYRVEKTILGGQPRQLTFRHDQ